jgi:lipid II:glycine glycyltransferase (peptidoglycan interpeptide bridge formation enzyme)
LNGLTLSSSWNQAILSFPETHFLQTWEWAQVKARLGWQAHYLVWSYGPNSLECQRVADALPAHDYVAACLILERKLQIAGFSASLSVLYAPRGPLLRDWADVDLRNRVLRDLQMFTKQRGAIFIKIDPEIPIGWGITGTPSAQVNHQGEAILAEIEAIGGVASKDQIQFRNTVLIDLRPNEDMLLKAMKQKTRYNIHLASRRGVQVHAGELRDLDDLYRMYAQTALRDGFAIRDREYYLHIWKTFMLGGGEPGPQAEPLIATVNGEAIAAVILFRFGRQAWFVYGMSREAHRDKMPNYLLQWEAIQLAKRAGCCIYDLWGAPDVFNETDRMWGVYRFKEGLGGKVVRFLGAWDIVNQPFWYQIYTKIIPRALDVLRKQGKAKIEQSLAV